MIPNEWTTLTDALLAAPAERPFVTIWAPEGDPDERTTPWGGFLDSAWGYQDRMRAAGLRRGDIATLELTQCVAFPATSLGVLRR